LAYRRSIAAYSLAFIVIVLAAATGPVSAQSANEGVLPRSDAAPDVGPADLQDAWLADRGPASSRPLEVEEDQIQKSWRLAPPTAYARAAALGRVRLELGLGDLPVPATLIARAATPQESGSYANMARELAPGVPAFQMAAALAFWRSGEFSAALFALGDSAWSIAASLAAQLWMLENFTVLLLMVLGSASLAFIVLAGLHICSHAAHDLGDVFGASMPMFATYACLGVLLLLPLVLGEGLLGLILALFAMGFLYGRARQRRSLAVAAVLLVTALHPIAELGSIATSLIERDPVASSVLQVLAGTETAADVERLEAAGSVDVTAMHALAYRARRLGLFDASGDHLLSVLQRAPTDFVALTNLGNLEKRRGNTTAAVDYYERAIAQERDATLLFDLSQAYSSAFRMEEYEMILAQAQRLDDRKVAALSSLGDAELVADLGFPMTRLRSRLVALALSDGSAPSAVAFLAPGRFGENWVVTGGAFALIMLSTLLLGNRWDRASLCERCGHRICTRCDGTVWSEDVCEDCHRLFQYPEGTDPSLRMARLQALSEREGRLDRIWRILSLLIPGVAGFAAKRPDQAMLSLLLFSGAVVCGLWPSGILEDPMLMGGAAVLCFALPGLLAGIGYVTLVVMGLIARKSF